MVRSARSIRWTTIKAGEQSGPASPPELQAQLAAIEGALGRGDYKPGPWQKLTDELRNRDQAERAALADDLTRVSRKLHLRRHRYTMSVLSGEKIRIRSFGQRLEGLQLVCWKLHFGKHGMIAFPAWPGGAVKP